MKLKHYGATVTCANGAMDVGIMTDSPQNAKKLLEIQYAGCTVSAIKEFEGWDANTEEYSFS